MDPEHPSTRTPLTKATTSITGKYAKHMSSYIHTYLYGWMDGRINVWMDGYPFNLISIENEWKTRIVIVFVTVVFGWKMFCS